MICAPEHLDYLVTAAEAYGTVPPGREQELWSGLFMTNIDSELRSTEPDCDSDMSMGLMLDYHRGYQRTELYIFPEMLHKALRTYETNAKEAMSYWSNGLVRQMLQQTLRAIYRRQVVNTKGRYYALLPAHITKETTQKDMLLGRGVSCHI